ncbi:carotenoid biosynthesis protein [Paenibacillus xylanilyticus]|uniref:Carotenoid biosynthesis protein n=1 Tax=Paenibacillus xylanilyticus TaxID=248903 RepID=A0A7Y6EUD7_9BACL|nr:carotenoid biosynthesis protein [Paenibacillus xylanilyticus]NUU77002.1 carotenoid biosynthesis protein [Paenibacillus xylanilyticus]
MIQVLYWVWYVIGATLMLTIGVPDILSFSNGLFLVFYALCVLDLIYQGRKRTGLSDQSVIWKEPGLWAASAILWLGGMGVEWVGVHTKWPFGEYGYSDFFGIHLFSVPVTLGFAWIAVVGNSALLSGGGSGWPGKLVRAVKTGFWAIVLDLVLDPVAHARGFWQWEAPGGFYGVPWTNYISWFIMGAFLSLFLPAMPADGHSLLRAKWVYQLFILLFGLLALKEDITGSFIIALVGALLAEGSWLSDSRRKIKTV